MVFEHFFKRGKKTEFSLDLKSFLPQSYTTLLSVTNPVEAIAILKETTAVDEDRRLSNNAGWLRQMISYAQKERENLLSNSKNRAEAFAIYNAEMKRSSKETFDFLQKVFNHLEPLFQRHKVEIVTLAKDTFTDAKKVNTSIQVPTTPENANSQSIYAQCRPQNTSTSDPLHQLVKPMDDFMIFASHLNGIHWGMEHVLRSVEKGDFDSDSTRIELKRAI